MKQNKTKIQEDIQGIYNNIIIIDDAWIFKTICLEEYRIFF